MSWDAWITNSLINCTDHGHSYANVLTEAAIVGFNGAVWAHTAGLDVKPDEVKKLTELFKQADNNTPSIMLGGKKYQVTHYEKNAFVYLKIKEGGLPLQRLDKLLLLVFIILARNIKLVKEKNSHKV